MPVVAIGGAILGWAAGGATALGALAAGSFTLGTIATVVGAVGATLGAIGAVTGDKTLSTIGMVMGGIGGLGTIATKLGLIDGAAESVSNIAAAGKVGLGGTAIDAGFNARDIANIAAGNVPANNIVQNVGAFQGTMSPRASEAGAQVTNTSMTTAPPAAVSGTPSTQAQPTADDLAVRPTPKPDDLTSTNTDPAKAANAASPPAGDKVTGSTDETAGGGNTKPSSAGGAQAPTSTIDPSTGKPWQVGATQTGADGSTTWEFDGTKWNKQEGFFSSMFSSPISQYALIQAAGSFLQGSFDSLKPAQVNQLNAQAASYTADADIKKQELANMQGNLPVARRVAMAPVTGLINQPPQGTVTGTV